MPKLKPAQPQAPEKLHPTIGYNEPTKDRVATGRGKSGCLCLNRNYYSLKCCQGYLSQQGVGLIYGPKVNNVFIEPSNP